MRDAFERAEFEGVAFEGARVALCVSRVAFECVACVAVSDVGGGRGQGVRSDGGARRGW